MSRLYGVGNYGDKAYSGPNPVYAIGMSALALYEEATVQALFSAEAQQGLSVSSFQTEVSLLACPSGDADAILAGILTKSTAEFSVGGIAPITFTTSASAWVVKIWYGSATVSMLIVTDAEPALEMASAGDSFVLLTVDSFDPYVGHFWGPETINDVWSSELPPQGDIWVTEHVNPWSGTNG